MFYEFIKTKKSYIGSYNQISMIILIPSSTKKVKNPIFHSFESMLSNYHIAFYALYSYFLSVNPTTCPLASSKYAKVIFVSVVNLGTLTFPPQATTFFNISSISSTVI